MYRFAVSSNACESSNDKELLHLVLDGGVVASMAGFWPRASLMSSEGCGSYLFYHIPRCEHICKYRSISS